MSELDEEFVPHNGVEELLISGLSGEISQEQFMKSLLVDQIFMPVKALPEDAEPGTVPPQPLIIEDADGSTALALFTSPERAKPIVEHFPGYEGGFLTELIWVLERFGNNDVVFNPGWPVGFELDSASIKAILAQNLVQTIPSN